MNNTEASCVEQKQPPRRQIGAPGRPTSTVPPPHEKIAPLQITNSVAKRSQYSLNSEQRLRRKPALNGPSVWLVLIPFSLSKKCPPTLLHLPPHFTRYMTPWPCPCLSFWRRLPHSPTNRPQMTPRGLFFLHGQITTRGDSSHLRIWDMTKKLHLNHAISDANLSMLLTWLTLFY